jgi:hypothetical protein
MRVLHGPVNVGNQPWALSRAERRLGIESDLIVNYNTWLDYRADRVLGGYGDRSAATLSRRIRFGMSAPFRYDVLHFYFGRSYLFFEDRGGRLSRLAALLAADLRLARRLGKKVVMTLQGCDARIASASHERNAWTMCAEGRCSAYQSCIGGYDAQRRRMIANLLPHCDRVFYLNPELGHELPGDAVFLPYASCDIDAFEVALPRPVGRPRIVHAPSNTGIKGTPMILGALEALRGRFDFELILVENKPHAEALRIYAGADIAIDQILAGWYGGFAVEMMASGKPVACAIRDKDLQFVPETMRSQLPLLRLRPDRVVDDLAVILSSQAQWPEQGRQARRFVERWHDPVAIARAMIACYRDEASRFDLAAAGDRPVPSTDALSTIRA